MIDWNSSESHIFLNPRMPQEEASKIRKQLSQIALPAHLWFTTSGTTGKYKYAALSKKALLASAGAVNRFFQVTQKDLWLHCLPPFHVGGLGVDARAYLSGSQVVRQHAWNAARFHQLAHEACATLSALVPTQLYDLVQGGFQAPKSYRFTIVGGGVVSRHVFDQSWLLGWNAVPSYGMTECGSQVATATPGTYDCYQPLDHVSLRIENNQRISIQSEALLTAYAFPETSDASWVDPKENGWFCTEDLGSLENGYLTVHGRRGDILKINGELVNLWALQKKLDAFKTELTIEQPLALIPIAHQRSGYEIHLVFEGRCEHAHALCERYNRSVLPFERIAQSHVIDSFPRSPLGKILSSQLIAMLQT